MAAPIVTPEMKKGSAELLILALIEERPRHGNEDQQADRGTVGGRAGVSCRLPVPVAVSTRRPAVIEGRWVEKAGAAASGATTGSRPPAGRCSPSSVPCGRSRPPRSSAWPVSCRRDRDGRTGTSFVNGCARPEALRRPTRSWMKSRSIWSTHPTKRWRPGPTPPLRPRRTPPISRISALAQVPRNNPQPDVRRAPLPPFTEGRTSGAIYPATLQVCSRLLRRISLRGRRAADHRTPGVGAATAIFSVVRRRAAEAVAVSRRRAACRRVGDRSQQRHRARAGVRAGPAGPARARSASTRWWRHRRRAHADAAHGEPGAWPASSSVQLLPLLGARPSPAAFHRRPSIRRPRRRGR